MNLRNRSRGNGGKGVHEHSHDIAGAGLLQVEGDFGSSEWVSRDILLTQDSLSQELLFQDQQDQYIAS